MTNAEDTVDRLVRLMRAAATLFEPYEQPSYEDFATIDATASALVPAPELWDWPNVRIK